MKNNSLFFYLKFQCCWGKIPTPACKYLTAQKFHQLIEFPSAEGEMR